MVERVHEGILAPREGPLKWCEFIQSIKYATIGGTPMVNGLAGTEQPLYEIKANLFKALAHPARIRVLEILSANGRRTAVSEILDDTGMEPRCCPNTSDS